MAFLKDLWSKLAGGGAGPAQEAAGEPVEYNGYRIIPEPFKEDGQYQTAGRIQKDFPDGTKEHRFVRAEKHPGREDALAFAVVKGRQIIDSQGDRIFG